MKKLTVIIWLSVAASIAAILWIHSYAQRDFNSRNVNIERAHRKLETVDSLTLSLEKFRRLNAGFRKMQPGEIRQVKDELKGAFKAAIASFDEAGSARNDRKLLIDADTRVFDLIGLIDRLEPTLYSRDAYQKPEVRDIHGELEESLRSLKDSMQKIASDLSVTQNPDKHSLTLLLGAGAFILLLVLAVFVREYVVFQRPLDRLHRFGRMLREGKRSQEELHLSGEFRDIQESLKHLSSSLDEHLRERHKFVAGVIADLREPFDFLQASPNPPRGLELISGRLEDLSDIAEINRLDYRLKEQPVDLSELISSVLRSLNGPEVKKRITAALPPMPVWAIIDRRRMERTLLLLLTRMLVRAQKSGATDDCVQISLSEPNHEADPNGRHNRGIEILIQESEKARNSRISSSGPEIELTRHWIAEKGLCLNLVQKVVQAHGGVVTASGVAGMSVQIRIRLPEERICIRGFVLPPKGLEVELKREVAPENSFRTPSAEMQI